MTLHVGTTTSGVGSAIREHAAVLHRAERQVGIELVSLREVDGGLAGRNRQDHGVGGWICPAVTVTDSTIGPAFRRHGGRFYVARNGMGTAATRIIFGPGRGIVAMCSDEPG